MTKEISTKVNYELAGYEGPVGVVEQLAEGDTKPLTIQVVQVGHRALNDPEKNVKVGSFIDGDTYETLALGLGTEKVPAAGINLIFVNLRKVWNVFELVMGKDGNPSKGDFIESIPWNPANAALYKIEKGKKFVTLNYRYIVKLEGDVFPRLLTLKGVSRACADDLNSFFSRKYIETKRPCFSYVINLRTHFIPTKHGDKICPYIHAVEDASEPDFLQSLRLYEDSKAYYDRLASVVEPEDDDEGRENPKIAPQTTKETELVKSVFEGAVTISEDEISF